MDVSSLAVPAYSVARQAARSIRAHFNRHLAAAGQAAQETSQLPDDEVMAAIIDAAFWASLRREEGFTPKISLAFVPPERSAHPLLFAQPIALIPEALSRLAPAVERAGIHLGVWAGANGLGVWGTTRRLPSYCFVLEVISPGLLVLKHSPGEDSGKFGNVAVFEGDKIKILALHGDGEHSRTAHLRSVLELASVGEPGSAANIIPRLAVSMRAHGRGGTLLFVPEDSGEWRESIRSISYNVAPPFAQLSELMKARGTEKHQPLWKASIRDCVDAIAGLTAVDGATVITQDYRVLAFGAKIRRRGNSPAVERVLVTEPVENFAAEIIDPAQLGGTRHVSATQFVHDHHQTFALVASQDGRFTLLAWSDNDKIVQAHRMETVLV